MVDNPYEKYLEDKATIDVVFVFDKEKSTFIFDFDKTLQRKTLEEIQELLKENKFEVLVESFKKLVSTALLKENENDLARLVPKF